MKMRYPGGKGASGVVQQIISLMPLHERYIEPFLGGGIVLHTKRPAPVVNIGADIDETVLYHHRGAPLPGVEYRHISVWELLPALNLMAEDLVYLDPPYHPETRTKKKIYRYEFTSVDHGRLLEYVLRLRCYVMISGYACPAYGALENRGWYRKDFNAMTRGGVRVESVWCNFTPGKSYHDTRFLGGNYRERERIKRKRDRWVARLKQISPVDRAVIWEALQTAMSSPTTGTDGVSGKIAKSAGAAAPLKTAGGAAKEDKTCQ